ncbi:hypothetical protein AB0M64_19825 [Streptomyces sp. NPDC051771]|uniref:hypothetical protein n=1 Tax=Streptomyces sp. NPDC051771 TaxID=3154847 RepID=UPI0034458A74
MSQRTAQELAQIAIGAIQASGGDKDKAKQLIDAAGLTTAEMLQALAYLESDKPILGRRS